MMHHIRNKLKRKFYLIAGQRYVKKRYTQKIYSDKKVVCLEIIYCA